MKYFLVSLCSLSLSILLSISESDLFGGTKTATDTLKTVTENINNLSQKVAQNTHKADVENLVELLTNSLTYLLVDMFGEKANITKFTESDPSVQKNFIDAWGTAADAIKQAAYKTSEGYNPTLGYMYGNSTNLLETPNAISIFNHIANNLNDRKVKQILQRYLKSEEDPTTIFKNIYYTLIYQWLTYKILNYIQYSNPQSQLEPLIENYKSVFLIDTKDSKLMTELKGEFQILLELLNPNILPQQPTQLTNYLQLVRDYMLGVVIPPMQLKPTIRLIPQFTIPAMNMKEDNLIKLSETPAFKKLKERDLKNPLVIKVEQDLKQLQPEPTTPQALLGYLTPLSTQLTQLHASITH